MHLPGLIQASGHDLEILLCSCVTSIFLASAGSQWAFTLTQSSMCPSPARHAPGCHLLLPPTKSSRICRFSRARNLPRSLLCDFNCPGSHQVRRFNCSYYFFLGNGLTLVILMGSPSWLAWRKKKLCIADKQALGKRSIQEAFQVGD